MRASSGLFRAGYLNEHELASGREQGAGGDVCGRYFDIDGQICTLELHDRIVGELPETLRRVPLSIGVAGGNSN
jgi:deoxyribonucleoside regulator